MQIGEEVKQGSAGGRVAFSIPGADLPALGMSRYLVKNKAKIGKLFITTLDI